MNIDFTEGSAVVAAVASMVAVLMQLGGIESTAEQNFLIAAGVVALVSAGVGAYSRRVNRETTDEVVRTDEARVEGVDAGRDVNPFTKSNTL